jgi:hypothetical protein
MTMLPPKLREQIAELERQRDDDEVSFETWEKNAMAMMQDANKMPPAIRNAFGTVVKQLGALERPEGQSAQAYVRQMSRDAEAQARESLEGSSTS